MTILNATEFADWWIHPNPSENYQPSKRSAIDYGKIGKALEVSKNKVVVPLCEMVRPGIELRYRFCRGAYALYDESNIGKLAEALKN